MAEKLEMNETLDVSTISASDINKFVYCPYQWYYEQLYGTKQLRQLYRARNEALGLTDTHLSHLNKGTAYHASYNLQRRWPIWRLLLCALLCAGGVALYVYFFK